MKGRHLTYIVSLIAICAITMMVSCESDKSKIEKCQEIVNTFVSNLSIENNDVLFKVYPNFPKIKRYWKIKDMKIVNSSIDAEKTVTIVGKSSLLEQNILLVLKKVKGEYVIVSSKGLASYFNSNLYTYCQKIGCFTGDIDDVKVSEICNQKKDDFDLLTMEIKDNIEHKFYLAGKTLKLQDGGIGNLYLYGDITLKNQSRFSIPGFSYKLYYHFYNSAGDLVFTKEEMMNTETIQYGSSISKTIMQDNANGFSNIVPEIKIISTSFIEQIIAANVTGSNCNADNNLIK